MGNNVTEKHLKLARYFKLGTFKTRFGKMKRNKNRVYFYRRNPEAGQAEKHIVGTLLACTRNWMNPFGDHKYTEKDRYVIYKTKTWTLPNTLEVKTYTGVKLKKHGKLNTTKWVGIMTRIEGKPREVEIRDGKGYDNSSAKVHHLLNYFSEVLEVPHLSAWKKQDGSEPPPSRPPKEYTPKTWRNIR